jgi:hypothetical protein
MAHLGPPFNQGHIRITKTREEILRILVENIYVRTAHFYSLLSNGNHRQSRDRSVRRVLKDFFNLGYIRRAPLVDYKTPSAFLKYEYIYWLSKSGLKLGRKLGLDNGARATGEKSPHSLVHEDEITTFHLELKKLPYPRCWHQRDLKRTVNPDALFALTDPARPDGSNTRWYFLEIEKSRQGHYRNGASSLLKKVDAYFRYFNSDKCQNEWKHFRTFRVIFVTRNEQRRQNLLQRLSEGYRHRMFWITTEELYKQDISGKIFQTPRDYLKGALYSFP